MINAARAIVDSLGLMTQSFRSDYQRVSSWVPIVGSGSPEGVVEAQQYRLYIRTDGTAGTSLLYIKMQAQISNDTSQGWELV